jgi:hypothetical protein
LADGHAALISIYQIKGGNRGRSAIETVANDVIYQEASAHHNAVHLEK